MHGKPYGCGESAGGECSHVEQPEQCSHGAVLVQMNLIKACIQSKSAHTRVAPGRLATCKADFKVNLQSNPTTRYVLIHACVLAATSCVRGSRSSFDRPLKMKETSL